MLNDPKLKPLNISNNQAREDLAKSFSDAGIKPLNIAKTAFNYDPVFTSQDENGKDVLVDRWEDSDLNVTKDPFNLDQQARLNRALTNYMSNDPNTARRYDLEKAESRALLHIGAMNEHDKNYVLHLKSLGMNDAEVANEIEKDTELKRLDPNDRLNNYLALINGDPNAIQDNRLLTDIQDKDLATLHLLYGDPLYNYLHQVSEEKISALDKINAELYDKNLQDGSFIANAVSNVAGGVGKGVVGLAETAENMITLFNTQVGSLDRQEKFRNTQEHYDNARNSITKNVNSLNARVQETSKEGINQLVKSIESEIIAREMAKGINNKEARETASKEADKIEWAYTTISKELILNGIGEQIPQIALSILGGGLGGAILKTASKATLEKIIKAEVAKKIGATIGIGITSGSQDGSSAYVEAYNNFANAEGQELERIKRSEGFKELEQNNPDKTDEEILRLLGDEAGKKAGIVSGLYTAGSSTIIGDRVAKNILNVTKNKSLGNVAKTVLSEGISEYGEEFVNAISPNIATNITAKDDIIPNWDKGAANRATEGALIAGATGALGAPTALIRSSKKAVKNVTNKIKEKTEANKKTDATDSTTKSDNNNTSEQAHSSTVINDSASNETKGGYDDINKETTTNSENTTVDAIATHLAQQPSKPMDVALKEYVAGIDKDLKKANIYSKKEVEDMTARKDLANNMLKDLDNKSKNEERVEAINAYIDEYTSEQYDDYAQFFTQEELDDFSKNTFNKQVSELDTTEKDQLIKNILVDRREQVQKQVDITNEQINNIYNKFRTEDASIKNDAGDIIVDNVKNYNDVDEISNSVNNAIAMHKENKISKDQLKNYITKTLSNYITKTKSLITKDSGKAEISQELNKAKKYIHQINKHMDELGFSEGYDQSFIKQFNAFLNRDFSKVKNIYPFYEKIYGNQKKGLLDYYYKYLSNNGTLDSKSYSELQNFVASQVNKRDNIANVINEMKEYAKDNNLTNTDDLGSYVVKDLYSLKNAEVTFNKISEAQNYLNQVEADHAPFISLTSKLLDSYKPDTIKNIESKKDTSGNKKVNTVKESQETIDDSVDTEEIDTPVVYNDTPQVKEKLSLLDKANETILNNEPVNTVEIENSISDVLPPAKEVNENAVKALDNNEEVINNDIDTSEESSTEPEKRSVKQKLIDNFDNTRNFILDRFNDHKVQASLAKKYAKSPLKEYEYTDSKGIIKKVSIPTEALVKLGKSGLSLEKDASIFNYIKNDDSLATTIPKQVIKNYLKSKINNQSLKQSDISNMLSDLLGDKYNNLSHDEKLNNINFVASYLNMLNKVYTSLNGKTNGLSSYFENVNADPLYANGIVNFLVAPDKGKPPYGIPLEIAEGITKGIITNMLGSSKFNNAGKQVEEYLSSNYDHYNPFIWDVTDVYRRGNYFNSATSQKYLKSMEAGRINFNNLGVQRDKFINDLGRNIIRSMGYKFNDADVAPEVINGITHSIGLEAYSALLENGMIRIHALGVTKGDTKSDLIYVNYINNVFPSTIDINNYKFNNTGKKLDHSARAELAYNNLMISNIKQTVPTLVGKKLITNADSTRGVTTYNIKNYKQPVELDPKNNKDISKYNNKLFTVNNKALEKSLEAHNKVLYKVNLPLYSKLVKYGKDIYPLFGYSIDIENQRSKLLPSEYDSLKSKNDAIERAIENMRLYVNGARDSEGNKIPLESIGFKFNHKVVDNSRIMIDSDLSPQADKVLRELIVVDRLKKETGEDGKEYFTGFDTATFKLPKMKKDNVRDITYLSKRIEHNYVTANQSTDLKNNLNLAVGLAQALGVKVENRHDLNTVKELNQLFADKDNLLNKVTDTLWNIQQADEQGNTYELSAEEVKQFQTLGETYGTDSSRVFNALDMYANYKYSNTTKDALKGSKNRDIIDHHMYIEADGVSNGINNINMQFTTDFSSSYLNTLKKTGNLPLDLIAQADGDISQGYAHISDPNYREHNKQYLDFYNNITDKLKNELQEAPVLNEFTTQSLKHELASSDPRTLANKRILKEIAEIHNFSALESSVIDFNALLNAKTAEEANSIIKDFYTSAIGRNVAKDGAIPITYGGGLKGVMNQTNKSLGDSLLLKVGDLYRAIASGKVDDSNYRNIANQLDSMILLEASSKYIKDPKGEHTIRAKNIKDMIESPNADFTATGFLNKLKRELDIYTKEMKSLDNFSESISTKLNSTTQEYNYDLFKGMKHIVAIGNAVFDNFITDFEQRYNQAVAIRNKKKGYSANDPRSQYSLSKKELTALLRSMDNVPLIGTAYTDATDMVDNLINNGSALVKEAYVDSTDNNTDIRSLRHLNAKNSLAKLVTQLRTSFKTFTNAGASVATTTVPSTESMTQTLTHYNNDTTQHLNVYDGLNVPFLLADALGNSANKALIDSHSKTNLYRSFLVSLNNAGFDKVIDHLDKGSINYNNKEVSVKMENTGDFAKDVKNFERDIRSFMNIANIFSSALKNDPNAFHSTDDIDAFVNRIKNKLDTLSDRYDLTSLSDTPENRQRVYNYMTSVDAKIASMIDSDRKKNNDDTLGIKNISELAKYSQIIDPNITSTKDMYNKALLTTANMVASNEAVKQVQNKYLPLIVNQFAGASKGYRSNTENNKIIDRFKKYVTKTQGLNLLNENLVNDSQLLSAFLKQDAFIQKEMNKIKKGVLNSLNVNKISTEKDVMRSLEVKDTVTVSDIIKQYKDNKGNSLYAKTSKVLGYLADHLVDKNTKVFSDYEAFVNAVADSSPLYSDPNKRKAFIDNAMSNAEYSNGSYHPNAGIYIRVNENNMYNNKDALHEVIHAMTKSVIHSYYVNGGEGISDTSKVAIESIEQNAIKFSKLMLTDPNINKLLRHLKTVDGFDVDAVHSLTSDRKLAVASNIYYAFNMLEANENVSNNDVITARRRSIDEFLAYGLTDDSILNTLHTRKSAYSKFTDGISKVIKKAKQAVAKLWGLTNEKHLNDDYLDNPNHKYTKEDSILNSLLSSLAVIAKDNSLYRTEQETINNGTYTNNEISNAINNSKDNIKESIDHNKELTHSFKRHLKDYMDNVITSIQRNLEKHSKNAIDSINTTMDAVQIVKSIDNKALNDNVVALRNLGIEFSTNEENAYKIAYEVNKLNFLGGNVRLQEQANNLVKDIINNINPKDFIGGQEAYNIVFNRKNDLDSVCNIIALLNTNEKFHDHVISKINSKTENNFKNITEKFIDSTIYKNRKIAVSSADNRIKSLSYMASYLDLNNKATEESNAYFKKLEDKKIDAITKINDFVQKSDDKPKVIKKMAGVINGVLSTGQEFGQDSNESSLGALIRAYIKYREQKAGRKTIDTKLLDLFVGANESDNKIHSLLGKSKSKTEAVRENLSRIAPEIIRKQFKEPLSSTQEVAIAKGVLPTKINRITNLTDLSIPLNDILTSDSRKQQAISSVELNIANELEKHLGTSKAKGIMNYIRWQTTGLGELSVKRTAKSKSDSHYILPNARVIASLKNLTHINPKTASIIETAIVDNVKALVALHSLSHIDTDTRNTLAELYNSEPEGFAGIMDAMNNLNKEADMSYSNNYLGYDGYVDYKRDPLTDIKIVKDPKIIKTYADRGYNHVATLSNGSYVMHSSLGYGTRYTNGLLNLTDTTHNGATFANYEALNSITGKVKSDNTSINAFRETAEKAMKDPNYYSKLEKESSEKPVINELGSIISFSTDLPMHLEKQLVTIVEDGIDAIGNYKARQVEEDIALDHNIEAVDALYDYYNEYKDKKNFIKFDGNYEPKGNTNADKKFADQVNTAYRLLPYRIKQYIQSKKVPLYVDLQQINNVVGYNQASLTDIFTGKSGLPTIVQEGFKHTLTAVGSLFNVNPVKMVKYAEQISSESASFVKDIILNRSLVVSSANLFSNYIHLWTAGMPIKNIAPLMKEGYKLANDYHINFTRLNELNYLIDLPSITNEARMKALAEKQILERILHNSPVAPLVKEGIFTSISSMADNVDINNEDFTLFSRFKKKTGIDSLAKSLPDSAKKPLSNILIAQGSATHKFMVKTLDYGDFVAKYALYQHLINNRRLSKERALNIIRDEFVNYNVNKGREFDYLNKLGVTWFLAYKVGIQKIIYRNLRRNTLRTLATYAGSKQLGLNTVPMSNIIYDSSLNYQTSPTNMFGGLKSHYLENLLGIVF